MQGRGTPLLCTLRGLCQQIVQDLQDRVHEAEHCGDNCETGNRFAVVTAFLFLRLVSFLLSQISLK